MEKQKSLALKIVLINNEPTHIIEIIDNRKMTVGLRELDKHIEIHYKEKKVDEVKENKLRISEEKGSFVTLEELEIKGYEIEYI